MQPEIKVEIAQLMASRESVMYVTAIVFFTNTSTRECQVMRYKLVWEGGSMMVSTKDFVIPAGQKRERKIRVAPDKGDLQALLDARGVRLDILESDCWN